MKIKNKSTLGTVPILRISDKYKTRLFETGFEGGVVHFVPLLSKIPAFLPAGRHGAGMT